MREVGKITIYKTDDGIKLSVDTSGEVGLNQYDQAEVYGKNFQEALEDLSIEAELLDGLR